MVDARKILQDLETTRDEIRLKIHLGSMEARQEFEELEEKFQKFKSEARLDDATEDVGEAASDLASEISKAYANIKKAL
ncbi:hypothetical protein [Roseibium sp.]|uniref:hypothetical protein n=1 Tax=Roseibium sp. TaxID=1936156 RepID=UPI00326561A0